MIKTFTLELRPWLCSMILKVVEARGTLNFTVFSGYYDDSSLVTVINHTAALCFSASLEGWEVDKTRGQKSWRHGCFPPAELHLCAERAGGASWRRVELAIIIRAQITDVPMWLHTIAFQLIRRGKYELSWPSVWSLSHSTKCIILYSHTQLYIWYTEDRRIWKAALFYQVHSGCM